MTSSVWNQTGAEKTNGTANSTPTGQASKYDADPSVLSNGLTSTAPPRSQAETEKEAEDLDLDVVWGVVYTVDPKYREECLAYLDHREKDGYSLEKVDVWGVGKEGGESNGNAGSRERIIQPNVGSPGAGV